MENAGAAMAQVIQEIYSQCHVLVLCGPGANGGDGYVVARHLRKAGWPVDVLASHNPGAGTDAHAMAAKTPWSCCGAELEIDEKFELIVDALFGAGLARPLEGRMAQWVNAVNKTGLPVISADLPSGLPGDMQFKSDIVICADHTVTFEVKKPAHLIGNMLRNVGSVHVVSIGIPGQALKSLPALAQENSPLLWPDILRAPDITVHKHARGRMLVVTGGYLQTGAARLAARSGLRMGAGWVSLYGPEKSMQACASHETSLVLHAREEKPDFGVFLGDFKPHAVVLGPAGGVSAQMRHDVRALCQHNIACVLDADALTSYADNPDALFALCHGKTVLTPHAGEFARLFPDLTGQGNKIDQVRVAANRAGCVVLCKGADTVIADPQGNCVVNSHATPWLASMGTGDVLAGMIGGLLAQGHEPFWATCAAVWMHGEVGKMRGPGLIAEDLPELIPDMLVRMLDR